MPEYTFNPETGSGEQVVRGGGADSQSIQEIADVRQEAHFQSAAENLSQRQSLRDGTDPTQVAGSGNLEVETRLAEAQKELFEINNGTRPHDALRILTLEGLQNTLAESLVTGSSPSPTSTEPAPQSQEPPAEDRSEDLPDMRDGMRNDPGIQAALEWGSENLDETVVKAIQYGLNSDDPEFLEQTVTNVQEIYRGREHVQKLDSHEDVGELSEQTLHYFSETFNDETAKNVQLINYGIRSGKLSMAEATRQSIKLGILPAMLQAAKELPDFNIASF